MNEFNEEHFNFGNDDDGNKKYITNNIILNSQAAYDNKD